MPLYAIAIAFVRCYTTKSGIVRFNNFPAWRCVYGNICVIGLYVVLVSKVIDFPSASHSMHCIINFRFPISDHVCFVVYVTLLTVRMIETERTRELMWEQYLPTYSAYENEALVNPAIYSSNCTHTCERSSI